MAISMEKLQQKVIEQVDTAKGKFEEVKEQVRDFDAKEQAAAGKEKAQAFFSHVLEKLHEAIAELAKHAQSLKDNTTEIPVKAFSNAFAKASGALEELRDRAKAFDEQHQLRTKVSDAIRHPREQASVAIAAASSYVTEAAHGAFSQLQGVSDGIKLRVMAAAEHGLDRVLPVAATCDERLHISEHAVMVTQQVKQFDLKYHVSDKLIDLDKRWAISQLLVNAWSSLGSLDQRITGGNLQPIVISAYEMGLHMAGYVYDKYGESKGKLHLDGDATAKLGSQDSASTAPPPEPKAEGGKGAAPPPHTHPAPPTAPPAAPSKPASAED